MTNAKLLKRLRTLLEEATNPDKKHLKQLRDVLNKLKRRRNELRDSLDSTDNAQEKQKIAQEIEVINLQRSKGVDVYKALKKGRKNRKQGKSKKPASDAPQETPAPQTGSDDQSQ